MHIQKRYRSILLQTENFSFLSIFAMHACVSPQRSTKLAPTQHNVVNASETKTTRKHQECLNLARRDLQSYLKVHPPPMMKPPLKRRRQSAVTSVAFFSPSANPDGLADPKTRPRRVFKLPQNQESLLTARLSLPQPRFL